MEGGFPIFCHYLLGRVFYYNLASTSKVLLLAVLCFLIYIYIYIYLYLIPLSLLVHFIVSLQALRLELRGLKRVSKCASMAAKSVSQNHIRGVLLMLCSVLLLQFSTFGLAATPKLHREEGIGTFPIFVLFSISSNLESIIFFSEIRSDLIDFVANRTEISGELMNCCSESVETDREEDREKRLEF